jgi:hypothetical protein
MSAMGRAKTRATLSVGTSLLIIFGVACDSGSKSSSLKLKTPTSVSLADQTRGLSHTLYADLPSGYGTATIDTSNPGVIRIGLFAGNVSILSHEAQLATAGTESGLWTAADAARMVKTGERDGIVRSDNGETTWSYQHDDGLEIVAPVSR